MALGAEVVGVGERWGRWGVWGNFFPENQEEHMYSQDFGDTSNYFVESYALYQGLRKIMNLGIWEVIVFCDSKNIIHHLYSRYLTLDTNLSNIFNWIYHLYHSIPNNKCLQVLKSNNSKVDHMANLGLRLNKCELWWQGKKGYVHLP